MSGSAAMPTIGACFSHELTESKRSKLRDEIRDFLRETCGLELSAEKTRITHVRDGYDFLGLNISVGVGHSGNLIPKVKVGRKAITNIQRRLGETLRYRPMQESISVRLVRASAVIRGWSNYFKAAHNFSQVAHGLDYKAYWIAVKAICRKEDISTAKCLRKYGLQNTIGVHEDCALARFQDTASAYYCTSPEPYQPGCHQPYPEDDEWEVAFVLPDRPRPGQRRPQVEGSGSRRLSLPWVRGHGHVQDLAGGPYRTCQPLCQPRHGEQLGQHSRPFVFDATSSKPRGNHVLRIIWKAGCLETCTSGLGLGPG